MVKKNSKNIAVDFSAKCSTPTSQVSQIKRRLNASAINELGLNLIFDSDKCQKAKDKFEFSDVVDGSRERPGAVVAGFNDNNDKEVLVDNPSDELLNSAEITPIMLEGIAWDLILQANNSTSCLLDSKEMKQAKESAATGQRSDGLETEELKTVVAKGESNVSGVAPGSEAERLTTHHQEDAAPLQPAERTNRRPDHSIGKGETDLPKLRPVQKRMLANTSKRQHNGSPTTFLCRRNNKDLDRRHSSLGRDHTFSHYTMRNGADNGNGSGGGGDGDNFDNDSPMTFLNRRNTKDLDRRHSSVGRDHTSVHHQPESSTNVRTCIKEDDSSKDSLCGKISPK